LKRWNLIVLGLLLAAPAAQGDELPLFQAALHGGYRMGGSLENADTGDDADFEEGTSFALALELRYAKGDDRYYQLWYSLQESEVDDGLERHDVDIEYLHIGGTLPFGGYEHAQPYFAAGLGATRFSSSAAGADDRTHFSGSMAFGLAVPLGKNVALRFEARGYLTLVDADSAIFCRSDFDGGVCRIVASGSSIFQAEGLAGIAVRF
jgi:opacity protein-like surface antigen